VSLWRWMERKLLLGEVLQDYGPLVSDRSGPQARTVSALVSRRDDADRFVIKTSHKAFLAASVQYVDLDRDAALKLKVALEDALRRMQ